MSGPLRFELKFTTNRELQSTVGLFFSSYIKNYSIHCKFILASASPLVKFSGQILHATEKKSRLTSSNFFKWCNSSYSPAALRRCTSPMQYEVHISYTKATATGCSFRAYIGNRFPLIFLPSNGEVSFTTSRTCLPAVYLAPAPMI